MAPKSSTPIPIFCKVATLRSTHSASRGGNENICGNKHSLRRHALLFHSAAQFFEQNSLVRGVLIDQDQAVGIFHQDIEPVEHTDDLKLRMSRGLSAIDGCMKAGFQPRAGASDGMVRGETAARLPTSNVRRPEVAELKIAGPACELSLRMSMPAHRNLSCQSARAALKRAFESPRQWLRARWLGSRKRTSRFAG